MSTFSIASLGIDATPTIRKFTASSQPSVNWAHIHTSRGLAPIITLKQTAVPQHELGVTMEI